MKIYIPRRNKQEKKEQISRSATAEFIHYQSYLVCLPRVCVIV